MVKLTDKQKEAMLQLGSSSCVEIVPQDVLDELFRLRLLYKRSDGSIYFTNEGDKLYDQLAGKNRSDL
ncbi:MAG: hypothetical protein RQ760_18325 [Sedimentisphaerales bacterium]|nr:hypothetical protein [Sedimentisphaerales bacterium]